MTWICKQYKGVMNKFASREIGGFVMHQPVVVAIACNCTVCDGQTKSVTQLLKERLCLPQTTSAPCET